MRLQRLLFMFFAVAVSLFYYGGLSYAVTLDVGSAGTYSTIQSGYQACVSGGGGTIQVETGTYPENDIFGSNIFCSLIGGYNSSFSTNSSSSYSMITGTLKISNGTTTAENIIINPPPTLVSITITPGNYSIPLGTTEQFAATGTYSDNSTQTLTSSVTWNSSTTSVATIAAGGKATSVSAGSTTITATSGSIVGTTTLTVNPPALESIAVTPAVSSIAAGATEQFTATGTYSNNSTQNITTSVTWSSSNSSVATISTSGVATGVAAGTTTITASSGSASPGSYVLTVTSAGGGANNVLAVTVNGSQCNSSINAGYTNDPCVSVQVCPPGTSTYNPSTCVTVNSILLDTGSYGLRIFQSALSSVSLTPVASGSGSLAECVYFGGGTSEWGPVQTASVILGNEPAITIPIHVIESTFPTIPNPCNQYIVDTSPLEAGFNGILGVGPFVQDCGSTCVNSTNTQNYYTCSGSRCTRTTVPLTNQVSNPVAFLPTDNNGLIVELPTVAASGVPSLNGSVVFGIGTQTNNTPSGVTTYPLDQKDEFITIFNGTTFNDASNGGSFIDTGSNALFFPTPSSTSPDAGELPSCSGGTGYFCPTSLTNFSATIEGASGSPTGTVNFQIGNFTSLTSSSNNVFGDIGADSGGGALSGSFDWGLPFYFGKNVFIGIGGTTSTLGAGPYFAY